ncbi:MAG: phytoene desaturase family protein [Ignavibacteria bacterium]|nr:phytoene desaturase family protein [Ignavibacteria bacterium]
MNIVVIGSGFGGISAAIRCLSKGHKVTIFEKLKKPGGRAFWFEKDGFTFDAGPTVITAPWLFEELFSLFDKKSKDYFQLIKLEPFYKIFFNDRNIFTYSKDSIINEVIKFNVNDADGYREFLKSSKKIFYKGFSLIDKPFITLRSMLKILPDLIKLRADKSVYKFVSEYIQNEYLRRAFSFHPLFIGGNPFKTTSIYVLIHYLEQKWGVWYAMGGTNSIVKGLCKLFTEQGGKIYYDSEVTNILCDKKGRGSRAKGVIINKKEKFEAEVVICNSDIAYTYKNLINREYRKKFTDNKINSYKYSMSLFVIYLGLKRKYDTLPHHSIVFSKSYKELLDDIFTNYKVPEEFSLYIHRPTATDSSIAPEGKDCLYILSPVPNLLSRTNWSTFGEIYKNKILEFLEYTYMPELRENIEIEFFITPEYFRDKLNSYLGSAFSLEPILLQSAYFRPHNRSEDVQNLYFVGAGTHPGAGIPGVISSAKIVERLIENSEES